jgi:hypothetical protein
MLSGVMTPRTRFLSVVAILLALAVPDARQQAPWFGTWRLNPARSTKRPEASPYKRVTTRIEPSGDGLKVTYDMVGTRGGVTHMEWAGRFDGRDYAVQGADYVLTNAYRRIDDQRYEIAIKVDGAAAATAVATVSADGRTLTVETTERGAKGAVITTTAVYERQEEVLR